MLDYKAPHSMFEWLADAQHVGTNNPNNLPPYTTFDAGVTAQLTRGTLTFAASNITNTFGGVFASPANAVAFTTAGGYVIPNIARPLAAAHVLADLLGAIRSRGEFVADGLDLSCRAARGGGPGGGPVVGGGGPRRRSGRRWRPGLAAAAAAWARSSRRCRRRRRPIRSRSAPTRRTCSADNAAKARQLSAELKAFVAQDRGGAHRSGLPGDDAGAGV